ncbi:methylated-DNA--[protein]-cysteine S-methyltransferase [Brevibacillus sp. H7]|jgi:methylated-DNA-[protein]-cysteine S-methyltransferase|uniref:methylated-DNA--[protein]-cysteine S-methyltransferase n=1 Tax=Brevibacillus sp. H7 TaxID=3349138 RepID=UPI0037FD1C27
MVKRVGYTVMNSPIGPLLLASTEEGLCFIEFGEEEIALPNLQRWCRKTFLGAVPIPDDEMNRAAKQQLEEYLAGTRTAFDLPIRLYGTPFQKAVWTELTRIPYGETRSYKDIALSIGAVKAVRAIGGANNRNPIPIVVPCHRVIGSNGALVGYGGGLAIKEHLLKLEGYFDQSVGVQAIR